jgi:hypothetical protein
MKELMRIHDMVAMVLVVLLILLLVNGCPQITTTLGTMNRIGPGYSMDDKVTGLITLGLIGAVLVAIVRILTRHDPK